MEEQSISTGEVVEKRSNRIALPAHRRRTGRIGLAVTPSEFERYRDEAIKAEMSLSEWVRYCCELAVKESQKLPSEVSTVGDLLAST